MTRNIIFTMLCFLTIIGKVNAQERRLITQDEAIARALEDNRLAHMARFDEEKAIQNRRQTEGMFLPQVSLNYSGMVTNNPLNAFGFNLQQGSVTQDSFNPELLNSPDATHQFSTSLEVKIPILNFDLLYAKKGAKHFENATRHQRQYISTQISYNVHYAYTALQMAYRSVEVLDSTLNDMKTISQNVTNFYNEGLVQKSDVMKAEVEMRSIESALAMARNSVSDASDQLKLAMGEPLGGKDYMVTPLRQERSNALKRDAMISMRDDILALQAGLDASEAAVKGARAALLPRLNAFGSYQFNSHKVLGFEKGAYMAGIVLSWNIFDGNNSRARLRAATAEYSRMQEVYQAKVDGSRAELYANVRKLEHLQAEIARREASVEQSAEALRVITNRHAEGLDTTTDLLTSRATLLHHQLEQAKAVMNYNIAYYYQQMLTKTSIE
ncbi:MAG: TolC family protein [Prevotella sp.]|uniref:TolC family protein n=1 Tax=Prevotella sp. TaxID=59823 RepID=UPI002A2C3FF3|nr:TolC family protein [Prevotella sp.]MDD7318076.1 TolC family protein [Prevotellaceae bacterium]MDY4021035.1 TolC family protein [Prevotella sp.]